MDSLTRKNDRAAVAAAIPREGNVGRRMQRARRRRVRRAIIAAGVLCALPGAWALAVRSPLARARMIDVTGASHLTRSRVLDLAGISSSTNVASLDATAAAVRLEADPWIADATVETSLPWTIHIGLVERTPVLALRDGPTDRIVAGDGTVLGEAPRDAKAFPVLRAGPPGAQPALAQAVIGRAASALAPIAPWGRDAIRGVSLARDGSLRLELEGGGRILYGDESNAVAKARTLVAFLRWSDSAREEIASVDLRVARAPTARLRSDGGG